MEGFMSALRFDPSLLKIYNKSHFQVRDQNRRLVSFTVKTLKKHPALSFKVFAVMTAWNPMNQTLTKTANRTRNRQLAQLLRQRGAVFYRSDGWLGRHCEEGFTIEGIGVFDAIQIARKFEQYAILYNDRRGPRFLRCCPGSLFDTKKHEGTPKRRQSTPKKPKSS